MSILKTLLITLCLSIALPATAERTVKIKLRMVDLEGEPVPTWRGAELRDATLNFGTAGEVTLEYSAGLRKKTLDMKRLYRANLLNELAKIPKGGFLAGADSEYPFELSTFAGWEAVVLDLYPGNDRRSPTVEVKAKLQRSRLTYPGDRGAHALIYLNQMVKPISGGAKNYPIPTSFAEQAYGIPNLAESKTLVSPNVAIKVVPGPNGISYGILGEDYRRLLNRGEGSTQITLYPIPTDLLKVGTGTGRPAPILLSQLQNGIELRQLNDANPKGVVLPVHMTVPGTADSRPLETIISQAINRSGINRVVFEQFSNAKATLTHEVVGCVPAAEQIALGY